METTSLLQKLVRSPRAVEALLVLASKARSGVDPSLRDVVEWLGVNDNRARKILGKLEAYGLVNVEGSSVRITEKGWNVVAELERILGVKVGADIAHVVKAVRERHVFYKVRTVGGVRSPSDAFMAETTPSPKIVLQKTLWSRLPVVQRFAGAIFIATDYERVRASESIDDHAAARAERAELSGIMRVIRLFAISLPPNLLGEPIDVESLIRDLGNTWLFAKTLLQNPSTRYRYLEQVDALHLARFDKSRRALYPSHESGLEAYKWLTRKLDNVLASIPDFYQPITVTLYSIVYNNLLTYGDIIEGVGNPTLEAARDRAGTRVYREVIERVFERRLQRYRLVEVLGRDRIIVPRAIFHKIAAVRGGNVDEGVHRIKSLIEAMEPNTRTILEYIVTRVVVTPSALAKDLGLSYEAAMGIVRLLADQGLLIPSAHRYLWVGVAPAKLIEEAIHRDLYIYLYDLTRSFDVQVKRFGGDLVEVLERLIEHKRIDLFEESSGDRKLLTTLTKYFFKLEELKLVNVKEGFIVEPASSEAVNLLRVFITAYVIPRGLDIVGEKVLSESTVMSALRRFRETVLDMLTLDLAAP